MMMYVKFSVITFAFLMSNTIAFTLGLSLFRVNDSLLSLQGILAVTGVLLANAAAVQLLIAGKYSIDALFYIGTLPIVGYLVAYLLFTRTEQGNTAILLYSLSLVVGVALLILTFKQSENKKSLVL